MTIYMVEKVGSDIYGRNQDVTLGRKLTLTIRKTQKHTSFGDKFKFLSVKTLNQELEIDVVFDITLHMDNSLFDALKEKIKSTVSKKNKTDWEKVQKIATSCHFLSEGIQFE